MFSMGKFAFIVHPREAGDIAPMIPITRCLPGWLKEKAAGYVPPFKLSDIRSPGGLAEGFLIAVPLTLEQMKRLSRNTISERIIRAINLADKMGAEVISLGGLSQAAKEAGIDPGRFRISIVDGISYNIATATEAAAMAASMMGFNLNKSHVAVLGATSPAESAFALVLSSKVSQMTLVGREKRMLEDLAQKILFHSGLSVRISMSPERALRSARVIAAGYGAGAVGPENISPGAVFCDLSGMGLFSRGLSEARDDVLFIEGGLVSVPGGIDYDFNWEYPTGMSCPSMAEAMIMALEGVPKDFTLYGVSAEKVWKLDRLAVKHGFKVGGIRGCKKIITQSDIDRIKLFAQKNSFM